jgi:chemotaxis response regulator CheB
LLEANPEWEVCGEAVNGQEALARANELHPDVIVLDFAMPVMNGPRAAQEITKRGRIAESLAVAARWTRNARADRTIV